MAKLVQNQMKQKRLEENSSTTGAATGSVTSGLALSAPGGELSQAESKGDLSAHSAAESKVELA